MPSEHAGGALPPGLFRVPVEWSDDQAQAVAVSPFPWEELEDVEGIAAEWIREGRPLSALLRELSAQAIAREREEILGRIMGLIVTAKKPGLRAVQIAFAAGLYVTSSVSGTELARRFGISKEAFQQGVDQVRRELGLRQTRTMRGAQARDSMRAANYRRRKTPKTA